VSILLREGVMWEHPTSLLAAPSNTYIGQMAPLFRAPLNTHTSNCAALFRAPIKQLRNAIGCPFQGPNQTSMQRYQLPFSGPPALQGQSVLTNHRQHTNPANRIKGDRLGL